jgi:hypothetical protein
VRSGERLRLPLMLVAAALWIGRDLSSPNAHRRAGYAIVLH